MSKSKLCLAVVTMAYNEADFLPIWLRHYGRQVGVENCYILDHGSTDGSLTQPMGAKVLRLPRTPLDEEQRCRFISEFCASLLSWYDFVAHVDVDELLIADPAYHDDLPSFCLHAKADVLTAFGMNVVHRLGRESELVPSGLIGRQRSWAIPVGSMCKPAIIARPVSWAPGFHSADAPVKIDDLFLMHLAFSDLDIALRRQRRRRTQARISQDENRHHQVSEAEVARWMEDWSALDEIAATDLGRDCEEKGAFVSQLLGSCIGREEQRYKIDISLAEQRLWRLPQRFAGAF